MESRRTAHIFILLALVAVFAAGASLHAPEPAFADTSAAAEMKTAGYEKADPEITYEVPQDLNLLSESFNLNARPVNCDAKLTYDSWAPDFIQVDEIGEVTIIQRENAFSANMAITASETETTKEKMFVVEINVDWVPQKMTCKSALSTTMGKPVTIKAKALGKLSYRSCDTSIAKVSSSGKVTFRHPGTVTIKVKAANTGIYWTVTKKVRVSCKMTAPKLTVSLPMKNSAKLTWTKVGGAQQYMIYVKYPGKKKFKPVLSKSWRVKSVTHKGLKKGKKYSYKVRAYMEADGEYYYGPYSKAVTVRIR